MSDGGEGFLDAFSGEEFLVELNGPLGAPIKARALLCEAKTGVLGIVESAEAIGRQLVVHPTSSMALQASSRPLGDLLAALQHAGATQLLVGLGGSATTDGGQGVFQALAEHGGLTVPLTVACDVEVPYLGALAFAQQKGIAERDLAQVEQMLLHTADRFALATGIDPTPLSGAGAAGGVGGALLCIGGIAVPGAALVAEQSGLGEALKDATVLITGEGALDATSLQGKVVGHLLRTAPPSCAVIVLAGSAKGSILCDLEALRPGTRVVVFDQAVETAHALNSPLTVATALLDDIFWPSNSD